MVKQFEQVYKICFLIHIKPVKMYKMIINNVTLDKKISTPIFLKFLIEPVAICRVKFDLNYLEPLLQLLLGPFEATYL